MSFLLVYDYIYSSILNLCIQLLLKLLYLVSTFLFHILQFDVLSSLHPTPAVCGLPTEEARQFIAETGDLISDFNCNTVSNLSNKVLELHRKNRQIYKIEGCLHIIMKSLISTFLSIEYSFPFNLTVPVKFQTSYSTIFYMICLVLKYL